MANFGKKRDRIFNYQKNEIFKDDQYFFESYDDALNEYEIKSTLEHRKKFAQHFTPPSVAKIMCDWIMSINPKEILDPAVGIGVFPATLKENKNNLKFTALDIDESIISYAKSIIYNSDVNFITKDFLEWDDNIEFDAIIANPPYLRHHDFHYDVDIFGKIGNKNNLIITKTMNIYGLFVIEICRRLKEGGRASIIIPSEWMNSNFGKPLKELLLRDSLLKKILIFPHEFLTFDSALTTSCILFIEKNSNKKENKFTSIFLKSNISIEDIANIVNKNLIHENATILDQENDLLIKEKKWDQLIRGGEMNRSLNGIKLGEIAKTKRGIATGANDFFHLPYTTAYQLGIDKDNLKPCIGKASDIKGLVLNDFDFDCLISAGSPTHLLNFSKDLNKNEMAYIKQGELEGLPERYLLAARKVWYQMEKRKPAPILAAVQGREGLRFIRNKCNILNLTAYHCIYPFDNRSIFLDALVVCLNSRVIQSMASFIQRFYGGGLIKVQPNDLLDLVVPNLSILDEQELLQISNYLPKIDLMYRSNKSIDGSLMDEIDDLIKSHMTVLLNLKENKSEESIQKSLF